MKGGSSPSHLTSAFSHTRDHPFGRPSASSTNQKPLAWKQTTWFRSKTSQIVRETSEQSSGRAITSEKECVAAAMHRTPAIQIFTELCGGREITS